MARAAGAVGHGQAGPPPGGPQQRPATVDDAGSQAASSPRGQQHVSTGHEDLQEGDADAPTHTPAEDPPQPNHPEKHNQDTSPTVTGPTTSTARSHDKQVPFSRAISTVLTEGRATAPTSPHPAPTRRSRTVRLQASSEPSSAGSPSQGRPAPLPGVSARFASSASASPDQPPALGSQRTGWSRRGRPRTPDPARHRPRPGRPLASATGTSTARPSPPRPSRPRRVDHGLVLVRALPSAPGPPGPGPLLLLLARVRQVGAVPLRARTARVRAARVPARRPGPARGPGGVRTRRRPLPLDPG